MLSAKEIKSLMPRRLDRTTMTVTARRAFFDSAYGLTGNPDAYITAGTELHLVDPQSAYGAYLRGAVDLHTGCVNLPHPNAAKKNRPRGYVELQHKEAKDYIENGVFCYGSTPDEIPLDSSGKPWRRFVYGPVDMYVPDCLFNEFSREVRHQLAVNAHEFIPGCEFSKGAEVQAVIAAIEEELAREEAFERDNPTMEVNMLAPSYHDFFTGNAYGEASAPGGSVPKRYNALGVVMYEQEARRAIAEGYATTEPLTALVALAKLEPSWLGCNRSRLTISKGYTFYAPEEIAAQLVEEGKAVRAEDVKPETDSAAVFSAVLQQFAPDAKHEPPSPVQEQEIGWRD